MVIPREVGKMIFTARKNLKLDVSDKQIEILVGCLLGDAYLTKLGKIQIEQSEKQKEYIDWKYQELASISYSSPKEVIRFEQSDNRVTKSFRFWTRQYFRSWREKFYCGNRKIFPKDLINFITPLIAGIVVGIGGLITNIIASLGTVFGKTAGAGGVDVGTGLGVGVETIKGIFPIEEVIPPFYFQLVVGLYLVQITYILTVLANGIENGVDELNKESSLGKNLFKSIIFYILVTLITTMILTLMARNVLKTTGGTL